MTKVTKHNHTHKYYKAKLGKKIIYRCAVPNCPHYVMRELVLNRMSICWSCGDPFILPHAISLLQSKPVCKECSSKRKKPVEVDIPAEALANILGKFD